MRLREQFAALDPIGLLKLMREAQRELARCQGLQATPAQAPNTTAFIDSLSLAWKAGEVRPTHMPKSSKPRTWRTRADPFEYSWPLLHTWLEQSPHVTAKELLDRLMQAFLDLYPTSAQLRTLQRRVQLWRADKAKQLLFRVAASEDQGIASGT